MPEDDENLLSASSFTSPSESSSSSEHTAEHNIVKEGEEGSREGKSVNGRKMVKRGPP